MPLSLFPLGYRCVDRHEFHVPPGFLLLGRAITFQRGVEIEQAEERVGGQVILAPV